MALARRPKGALDVASSIGFISTSMYGCSERTKYIVDGNVSIQLGCIVRIVQNLDIEHFAGHLVNDVVQNHHKFYGCSNKTLLAMVYLLANSANNLKEQGLSEESIAKGLHQAVELCISNFQTMPLKSFFETLKNTEVKCSSDAVTSRNYCTRIGHNEFPSDKPAIPKDLGETDIQNNSEMEERKVIADMVELKMKPSTATESEDNEDYSWYFDKKEVQNHDEAYKSMVDNVTQLLSHFPDQSSPPVNRIPSKFLKGGEYDLFESNGNVLEDVVSSGDYFLEEEVDPIENCEAVAQHLGGEENEFDDCFVGISFKIKGISVLKSTANDSNFRSLFNLRGQGIPYKNERGISEYVKGFHVRDSANRSIEDHSAFMEVDLQATEGISDRQDISERNFFDPVKTLEKDNSLTTINNSSVQDDEKRTKNRELLEKLECILAKKSERQKAANQNYSRHFRTVESVVKEKENSEQSVPLDISESDLLSLDSGQRSIRSKTATVNELEESCLQKAYIQNISEGGRRKKTDFPFLKTHDLISSTSSRGRQQENSKCDESSLELKLQDILASKPKLNIAKLQSGSRHLNANKEEERGPSASPTQQFKSSTSETKTEYTSVEEDTQKCEVTYDKLRELVVNLSHGCSQIEFLVATLVWNQQEARHLAVNERNEDFLNFEHLSFDVGRVHSVSISNTPFSRSQVVDGFVVHSPQGQLELIHSGTHRRRTLLIKGDVGINVRHKGMNKKVNTKVISSTLPSRTRQQRWLKSLTSILEELSVGAILAKGKVCEDVRDWCMGWGIVVIPYVPSRVLLGIAEASDVHIATYVTECTEDCVVEELDFEVWRSDWMDQVKTESPGCYVKLSISGNLVQTVSICHPCGDWASILEEQCWHVLHRVEHVIENGLYMLGCPENYLPQVLQDEADRISQARDEGCSDDFRSHILRNVADAFISLQFLLYTNISGENVHQFKACLKNLEIDMTKCSPEDRLESLWNQTRLCFDDSHSKTGAYRNALFVVRQLLVTDYEIITGLGQDTNINDPDVIGII